MRLILFCVVLLFTSAFLPFETSKQTSLQYASLTTTSLMVALEAVDPEVTLSGKVHIVSQFAPVDPCRFSINLVSVQGSFSDGTRFNLTGSARVVVENVPADGSINLGEIYFRLIPVDPCTCEAEVPVTLNNLTFSAGKLVSADALVFIN